ncbi:hypothetical protein FRC06_006318, partial [Ceratobasidium sp. 370]
MERYCNYVKMVLCILQEHYHLNNLIKLTKLSAKEKEDLAADRVPNYNTLLFTPSSMWLTLTNTLKNQIVRHLNMVFKMPAETTKKILPVSFKQWGQMRLATGGDLVYARGYHTLRQDRHNASFVRYELLVPRCCNAPKDLV